MKKAGMKTDAVNANEQENSGHKKRVSYFHRTAQPSTLALFPTWGI